MAGDTPSPIRASTTLDRLLSHELDELSQRSLRRSPRAAPAVGKYVDLDGRQLLNLTSNDYLGLANHPQLIEAARNAAKTLGVGATASRLVSGTLAVHEQAEREVARLKHAEAALLLATGYTANLAVLGTLAGPGDLICQDKLNHASLIDAARSSGAQVRTFAHLDYAKLERLLKQHAEADSGGEEEGGDFWDQVPDAARAAAGLGERSRPSGRGPARSRAEGRHADETGGDAGGREPLRFIVTDSVFSMDGDCADLPTLCDLADRYRAVLVVDEAHGTGVLGETGGGLAEHQGVAERVYRCGMGGVVVSTASKAMGGMGGLVTGSRVVIDYLVNRARPLIYSTGVSPMLAAVVAEAAMLVMNDNELRPRLARLCEDFSEGLRQRGWPVPANGPATPIFPLVMGTSEAAMAMAQRLRDAGLLAVAIRPPTVPPGTARVRLSLRADMTDAELLHALDTIGRPV